LLETLDCIIGELQHLRALTTDLLDQSTQAFLEFSPHADLGPTWKQFRHSGRVEENYTRAIDTKNVEFNPCFGKFWGESSRENLLEYLWETARVMTETVGRCDHEIVIEWYDDPCCLTTHLTRLATHESLHHGQLILYARSAAVVMPSSWAAWGE
jgi:hypothetical protein